MIPVVVFVAGLIIFSRVLNQGVADLTTEMSEATLPIVYMMEDGERINELHGYTTEMDATSMRDTVTPVQAGDTLSISIDSYGAEISSISCEVRNLDGSQLVQQSEAEHLSVEEDVVTADLLISDQLAEKTEYLMVLQVTGEGDPCYYYTRIVENENEHVSDCIAFAKEFHETTMSKTRQKDLTAYMETASGADNNTLHFVTLQNTLSQVCWGDFQGTEVADPVVSIKEINDSYNVIILDYVITYSDEQDNLEYYNVEEYYRIRWGEQRMFILDFERTVDKIFRGESSEEESSHALNLGIRSSDVDYMSNETGTVVCFVQQGELWSYNPASAHLTQIYSFRSLNGIDARENYDEHDIRIIRTNETGSVDFVVYGYMNRGEHEGQVGVSICHYDSATATVEEQVFLPSDDSYQVLQPQLGQAMYITDSGLFYLVLGDQVYSVDLDTKEYSVPIFDMTEGNYASSEDGRYLAWTEGDATETTTMHLMDLETGRISDIEAPEGSLIRPLGFMDSDCVYGLVAQENVNAESSVFPMSRVVVVDFSDPELSVLKTYDAQGAYVTGAEVRDGNIYLERMIDENGKLVEADEDVIYNRDMQDSSVVYVSETYDEIKEAEVTLQLPATSSSEPELQRTKMIRTGNTELNLFDDLQKKKYYVYAKGKVILGTDYIGDAVISADENSGVVIGDDQECLWNTARSSSGELGYVPSGSYDDGEGTLNLTGCTLNEVLYYVGIGIPVYAVQNGQEVVITGYNDTSVTIYEPAGGTTVTQNIDAASEDFAFDGNIFFVTLPE